MAQHMLTRVWVKNPSNRLGDCRKTEKEPKKRKKWNLESACGDTSN
jgi:hypothetical protein